MFLACPNFLVFIIKTIGILSFYKMDRVFKDISNNHSTLKRKNNSTDCKEDGATKKSRV